RAEIDARMRELERPTTPAPGNTAASRPVSNVPTDSTADNPLAYAQTYYPGTPISSNAIRIRVAAGEERNGVDIPLIPVRAARLSGVVNGAGVAAQRARLSLT